ncbi:hypothetical protein NHQ30_004216 [Ciborinia camelliae]|nr:hypothetical protein NHQ30_004216 [Ciborinia camelliae]
MQRQNPDSEDQYELRTGYWFFRRYVSIDLPMQISELEKADKHLGVRITFTIPTNFCVAITRGGTTGELLIRFETQITDQRDKPEPVLESVTLADRSKKPANENGQPANTSHSTVSWDSELPSHVLKRTAAIEHLRLLYPGFDEDDFSTYYLVPNLVGLVYYDEYNGINPGYERIDEMFSEMGEGPY